MAIEHIPPPFPFASFNSLLNLSMEITFVKDILTYEFNKKKKEKSRAPTAWISSPFIVQYTGNLIYCQKHGLCSSALLHHNGSL